MVAFVTEWRQCSLWNAQSSLHCDRDRVGRLDPWFVLLPAGVSIGLKRSFIAALIGIRRGVNGCVSEKVIRRMHAGGIRRLRLFLLLALLVSHPWVLHANKSRTFLSAARRLP